MYNVLYHTQLYVLSYTLITQYNTCTLYYMYYTYTQVTFESVEAVVTSDHKPVRAFFLIETIPGDHGILVKEDKAGSFDLHITDLKVT